MERVSNRLENNLQEKLNFLFRIGRHLQSEENKETILKKILDEIIGISGADQGYLFKNENNEVIPVFQRSCGEADIPQNKFMFPGMIINHALQSNQPILVQDTQTDNRYKNLLSILAFHLQSFLCIPFVTKNEIPYILYLQQTKEKANFHRDHLELIQAVIPAVTLLIENSDLQITALEKGRMQREMQMARDVQNSLIPDRAPNYFGWKAAFCWQPASEVGGDFFDFIPVDDHTLGLVIADVSDKGMPAALFMALSRTILRAVVGNHISAAEMITRANHLINHDAKEGMFVTLFFGLLNLTSGEMTYVNGGHNPPLFYDHGSDRVKELKPTGMAVGMDLQAVYEEKTVKMQDGDFIFLYTDGALDAVVREKAFGEKELHAFIRRHRNADPDRIVNLLKERLCGINVHSSSHDDLTIIVWKRIGKQKKE